MIFSLSFKPKALKEWKKLDLSIKSQFKKKLKERLLNPKVTQDKLSGYENVYKIKLKSIGYRLAYEVKEDEVVIIVLVVGKRENNRIYKKLKNRI
jgi:mRNA interferase RelE/StbE